MFNVYMMTITREVTEFNKNFPNNDNWISSPILECIRTQAYGITDASAFKNMRARISPVGESTENISFLANGEITFTGKFSDEKNCNSCSILPKWLEKEERQVENTTTTTPQSAPIVYQDQGEHKPATIEIGLAGLSFSRFWGTFRGNGFSSK